MSNDSKQENKVWYNGSGHELQARASGGSLHTYTDRPTIISYTTLNNYYK